MRILVGVCALSRWTSNTQPVGLRQHHLQDRHEGRRLAEVAVAHDVCVDVEPVGVAAALDAAGHVVKTTDNSWRQLEREREVCVSQTTIWKITVQITKHKQRR